MTVTVENVPDAPDAVDDTFDVEPGAQAIPLFVLGNDVNPDQAPGGIGWYSGGGIVQERIDLWDDADLNSSNLAAVDSSRSFAGRRHGRST